MLMMMALWKIAAINFADKTNIFWLLKPAVTHEYHHRYHNELSSHDYRLDITLNFKTPTTCTI